MARGLAVAVVALLVAAAPASAANISADCTDLQAKLTAAADTDVITLNSSAAPGGLCNAQYTLHDFGAVSGTPATWTLKGRDGMNDGFDGSTLPGRVLTGDDVHRLLIQDLTFRDSSAPAGDGGAISITGESSLQIFTSEFYANTAGGQGGAVSVASSFVADAAMNGVSLFGNTFGSLTTPSEGNSADTGGAVAIQSGGGGTKSMSDNVVANNVAFGNGGGLAFTAATPSDTVNLDGNDFIDNQAGGSGGGAYVEDGLSVNLDNEVYDGNRVAPITGFQDAPGDHVGGGFVALGADSMTQERNVFSDNSVETFQNGLDYSGGGAAVVGDSVNLESSFDRYLRNTVAGQPLLTISESEGGGLYFSGADSRFYGFLTVVAGNTIGAGGEGGGIYVGAPTPATTLELGEATVAGNAVGAGGQFAGIAGDPDDDLIMRNSIVYNSAQPDIGGFDSFDVRYSDACNGGAAFGGPGNICADPRLVGFDDIHQTTQSPTIDKGSDEFFDDEGGGERALTDYEGDLRPTDGDGDGHTIDMGADETPAGFSAPPPPPPSPPPPPPQCSDGTDNDGDGAIDAADPGCLAGPTDDNEGDENLQDVFLCGERTISLVRADVRRSRVVLSGIVAKSVYQQPVELFVRYLGRRGRAKRLATVTPGADGQFQRRVKKPPARLFNRARYRARVGSARSVELKLPQSLASTSLKQVGGMLELRGEVTRAVLGKRNAVVVKRILCGKYTTVGQARPNRRGVYVVRFPAPSTQGSALYRAETRVLARPGSKRYVKQFARAIGISF